MIAELLKEYAIPKEKIIDTFCVPLSTIIKSERNGDACFLRYYDKDGLEKTISWYEDK